MLLDATPFVQKSKPWCQNYARKICCSCAAFQWQPPFVVSLTIYYSPRHFGHPLRGARFSFPVICTLTSWTCFFLSTCATSAIRMPSQSNRDTVAELPFEVLWCRLCIMKTNFQVAIVARYYITQLVRDRVGITLDPDHEAQWCQPITLTRFLHFFSLWFFRTSQYSIQLNTQILHRVTPCYTMFHLNVTAQFQFEMVRTGCLWDGLHASWLYTSTISESRWCRLRTNWRSHLRYLFVSSRRDPSRDVGRDFALRQFFCNVSISRLWDRRTKEMGSLSHGRWSHADWQRGPIRNADVNDRP